MALVLVTGGTGQLGREVVPRLVSGGHDVRLLSRQDRPSRPDGVEAVRGDVLTGDGLDRAVTGVDVVVHCATSPFRRTRRTEVDGTRRLTVAARGGRPHVVYISIVGVDRHPLPYYKAKRSADMAIEAAGLPYTILRATQFHSLLDAFLTRIKIATYGGIVLALPVWLFELWRFITPGLNPKEKRYAIPFILASIVLFAMGSRSSLGEKAQPDGADGVVDVGVDQADGLPGAQAEVPVQDGNGGVRRYQRR